MRPLAWIVFLGASLAVPSSAWADENLDLDRIPESLQQPSGEAPEEPAASAARGSLFLENAVTSYAYRGDLLVPPPASSRPTWQERLSLDTRQDWTARAGLHLLYSGRFNIFAQDDILFPSQQTVRLDIREAYASWEALPRTYFDAGRINLKSGVAVGFNPTDYFKARAVVDRSSQDPSVLRENRLGTLMVRGQHVWDGGAVSLAFAPSAYNPTAIMSADRLPSFDPMFERTNAQQRSLLKANLDVTDELSPEILVYQENTRTRYGLNATYGIGKNIVAYAEWSGGDRASVIAEAFSFGKLTGTIPANAPQVLPSDPDVKFRQDLAAGLSYATASKVTLYLEYDYHEAGLSRQDWKNWFAAAQATRNAPTVVSLLWYLRSYALDQQEPLTRQAVFMRVSWTDAFVRDLELTGLVSSSQYDDSSLAQVTASYYLSSHWTIGALGTLTTGSVHSEQGSLPLASSILLKAIRYF